MIPPFRSPAGASALARLLSRPTLLAFDYDGTLSPLCAEADSACVDAAWSARLRRIAHRWPVAVISGRTLVDVTSRLGFQAAYIAGNHGAESPGTRLPPHISGRLDLARIALARDHDTLARAGVVI